MMESARMQNRSIVDVLNEALASSNLDVPVFHSVALRLQQTLSRPDFTIEQIEQMITVDPGLAGQVLRIANSSFYSGLSKVTTVRDAIVRLGAREIANLAMVATQSDFYRSADPKFGSVMRLLWKHAFCCAIGSKWLAGKLGYETLAQEAFLAGLLHDIGKLFLLKVLEGVARSGELGREISPVLISEVLNSMHVSYGSLLMEKWDMPDIYRDMTCNHHEEEWQHSNVMLTIVRLVNQSCNKLNIGMRPNPALVLFTTPEAQLLGVKEIILAELEIALEDGIKMAETGASR
jgi:HD-like signal output (HDOD) protein